MYVPVFTAQLLYAPKDTLSAIFAAVTASSAIFALVTASSAKSASTIVAFTIFAEVTILSDTVSYTHLNLPTNSRV